MNPTWMVGWLVSAMLSWSPWHAGETRDATRQRYEEIAYDAAAVALEDSSPEPWATMMPGAGPQAGKTALLMLAIASYESGGFRADVDSEVPTGDCRELVSFDGTRVRSGCRSRCLAQIQLRAGENMLTRWDCFRLELARIRESYASCSLPLVEGLAVYASGRCDRGTAASSRRVARAVEWWSEAPLMAPIPDA